MSRIGKMPIAIPAGVTVETNGNIVTIKPIVLSKILRYNFFLSNSSHLNNIYHIYLKKDSSYWKIIF